MPLVKERAEIVEPLWFAKQRLQQLIDRLESSEAVTYATWCEYLSLVQEKLEEAAFAAIPILGRT